MHSIRTPRLFPGNFRRNAQYGITLLEIIIFGGITSTAAALFLSFSQTWPSRLELQGTAERAGALILQARLEEIQRGVTTVVEADLGNGQLRAYADVNGHPSAANPGHAHYLRYDPFWKDGALDSTLGPRQTDYEIGFLELERTVLAAPNGWQTVEGLTPVPGAAADTAPVVVFLPTGVVDRVGALRFADRIRDDGGPMNFVETKVSSLTGRVEVRKFLLGDDSPTGSAGFFAAGKKAGGENLWVWY